MRTRTVSVGRILATTLLLLIGAGSSAAAGFKCRPTEWREIGPFYRPGAPERDSIGTGYILSGTVKSAADCEPIAGARIEVWQVGPDGSYDDAHRATLRADGRGRYRLSTSFPPPYGGGRSHIHLIVDAKGYDGVVTQHFPRKGARSAVFDLVLAPESARSGKGHDPLGRPLPETRE